MKDELTDLRREIDEIDSEAAVLFEKRMDVCRRVARVKAEQNLPVFDATRERAVVDRNVAFVREEYRPSYRRIIEDTMAESKALQKKLTGCLSVNLGKNSYDIVLQKGCIDRVGETANLNRRVLLVTDDGVPEAYVKRVAVQCKECHIVTLPQGEKSKNVDTFVSLLRTMLSLSFDRTDCVAAVGGGTVGDVAAFAASCYMRGVDFYNIPTTLLAQVDSSVGGKTAIDMDGVKNCVGTFYQPKGVFIDPDVLSTLPKRQRNAGMAEIIKCAVIGDAELFAMLEKGCFDTGDVIRRALRVKINVVEQDELEKGLRKILNFGHTLGHGIEAQDGLLHGECVALGMAAMCNGKMKDRLLAVLEKYDLPTSFDGNINAVMNAVLHDKKAKDGFIEAVYADEIGKAFCCETSLDELKKRLEAICV